MAITIDNKELATDLITLAVMCANEGTDNCDITLTTTKGKINCHIEFEGEKMGRLIEHIKRWNVWRKYNRNGIAHKILVLFGIIKSPTFFYTWTAEEAQAFYDGFMEVLEDGSENNHHASNT